MKNQKFPVESTIHILNRCNELLKRKSETYNVKQEYYYWIDWLKIQFKNFYKIHDNSKKKVLKTLNKVNKLLVKNIGYFKNCELLKNNKIKNKKGGQKLILTDKNIKKAVKLWLKNKDIFEKKYGSISKWDVSKVTDMSNLFDSNNILYQDIENFNNKISNFNEDLSKWNVINVTTMDCMFSGCGNFNKPLCWGDNTKNVKNMDNMFSACGMFNQQLYWNVSNVTSMVSMFDNALKFNQNLNNWNVSNVTNMKNMFFECSEFNGNISSWDVSKVNDMNGMFSGCKNFNRNLSRWNVSNVTNMDSMFENCTVFNQDLSEWNVLNIKSMNKMFFGCISFKQNLSKWNISKVTNNNLIFSKTKPFIPGQKFNIKNKSSIYNDLNIPNNYKPKKN